jgi:hypothetical protein
LRTKLKKESDILVKEKGNEQNRRIVYNRYIAQPKKSAEKKRAGTLPTRLHTYINAGVGSRFKRTNAPKLLSTDVDMDDAASNVGW